MCRVACKQRFVRRVSSGIAGGVALSVSLGAAPPDFALAGLAPPNADVLIRIDFTAPHVGPWTEVVERMLSSMVGEEAITHWNSVRTRCKKLGGPPGEGPCSGSLLALRFDHDTDDIDWTLVSPLFDRTSCQQGLQDLGTNVAANGCFRVGPNGPLLRASAHWVLAGPLESKLAHEMAVRAEADERASSDQAFKRLVNSLSTAPIEIVVRTPDSDNGMIAFSIAPIGAHTATVQVVGAMEVSPFGIREAELLDLSLLERLAEDSCFAMIESGGEHFDPALMQMMLGNLDLLPPPSVQAAMTRSRIMVVSGESVEVQGVHHAVLPVACVGLPLGGVEPQAEAAIDRWMSMIGRMVVLMLGDENAASKLAEPTVGAEGIRHLDVGSLVSKAVGGQLLAHAFSLNWATVTSPMDEKWMVIGSSEVIAGRVAAVLREDGGVTNTRHLSMAGIARPHVLAGHLKTMYEWYAREGGEGDEEVQDVVRRIRVAIDQLDRVSWQFTKQTERGFKGAFQLRLTQGDVQLEPER